jgi:hypothetical protein
MSKDIILDVAKDIKDADLLMETMKESKAITSGKLIEYKPNPAYELIFPDGLQLYYNQIIIYLLFDGRTYKLTQDVINFIEDRITSLITNEKNKNKQYANPVMGSIN